MTIDLSTMLKATPLIEEGLLIDNFATELAQRILTDVIKFRRMPKNGKSCSSVNCSICLSNHLPKIISAIQRFEPVVFVLPAFPGKSPNPEKVLGILPDQGERLALTFLQNLCQQIKTYYAPGMKIILCSDGRVFSDVVGMDESHVTAYQIELDRLIRALSFSDISTFDLDDFYNGLNFMQMRKDLMNKHGIPLEDLKENVLKGASSSGTPEEKEANSMYCGITRFLVEDSIHAGQTKSRAAIQRESRSKAYEVIRRSNAWSGLISENFPGAVRLSIHPQACGSKKLGIRLIGNESWMTPWHGVAVETNKGYTLLKRSEAESLGAKLIYSSNGLPSHYQLETEPN